MVEEKTDSLRSNRRDIMTFILDILVDNGVR